MAKKDEKAMVPASVATTALTVAGYDDGGNAMSDVVRLAMHSGSNEDQAKWPDAKAGDWIDGLDGTNYGQSIKFVPLAGFMSWSRFDKGQKLPVYATLDKSEVPPEDLKWGADGVPPPCVEAFNYVGLIEGAPFVYRVVFKRTGFKVGETIKKLQQRRDMQQAGPGVYVLTSKAQKNKADQTYRQVTVSPGGNPTAETIALATKALAAMTGLKAKAEAAAKEGEEHADESEAPPPF